MKGWIRTAAVLFLGAQLAAATAPAIRVRIEVVGRASTEPPLETVLTLRPMPVPPGGPPTERPLAATAPGETVVTAPAAGVWQVGATAKGFWSEPVVVTTGGEAEPLAHLRLFPVGIVRGTLEAAKSNPLPSELEVRFQPAPGQSGPGTPPKALEPCALAEGAFDCAVPAGRLDLRLRAPGFAAIYRWDAVVPVGGVLDLGTLRLEPGSSVVGWVETEEGRAPTASALLRLGRHHLRQGLGAEAEQRLEALSFETRANERGFFQFQGVPPGLYAVTAALEGLAPATVEGVEVRAGLEAELVDALVLARPVRFEAEITPPHDPYGQPWQIALSRHDSEGFTIGEQVEGVATLDGHYARGDLPPGTYSVRVRTADGSQWFSEDEVAVGAVEPPLFIRIPILEVEGTVRLGDQPLVATLWFGGRHGAPRIRFDTDLKGRFEGLLPRAGRWAVDLTAEDPYLRQSVPPVVVEEPDGGGTARVDVVLPDTLLAGEVVDESGRPLPDATVSVAAGKDQRTEARTDERGAFSLRGLPPGSHGVRATAGERSSGWLKVEVNEGRESRRLRLVAARVLEIDGVVLSPAGAVAGAQLMGFPDLGGAGMSTGVDAVSDPLGRFRLTLPAGTRGLRMVVLPPGNALRMLHAPIEPGRPLEIAVQPSGAALVLELPADASNVQLAHGGMFLTLGELLRWARLAGGRKTETGDLLLPEMEPGEYIFCVDAVPRALWESAAAAPVWPGCASGTLAPYSTLALRPSDEANATK